VRSRAQEAARASRWENSELENGNSTEVGRSKKHDRQHTKWRTQCSLTGARNESKGPVRAMQIWQLSVGQESLLPVRDLTSRSHRAVHAENSKFQTVIVRTRLLAAAVQKTLRTASVVSVLEEERPR
jgi:hypothetical protein